MWRFFLIFPTVLCLCQGLEYVLTAVELSPAGASSNATRIVGGTDATIEQYPYTVQIIRSNQLLCGGSLLTQRHVLSAAHCFVNEFTSVPNPNQFSVRLGTTKINSGGTVHSVSAIVVHEGYSRVTHDADVAVLVLGRAAALGARVATVAVPARGATLPYDTALTHVGWGNTNVTHPALALVLQQVEVLKVNRTVCAQRYRALAALTGLPYAVTGNMICAGLLGVGGADACQGDSGGPLIYRSRSGDVVVGVTSWGLDCGDPYFPGVSARVASFTDWINATVTRYNAGSPLGSLNVVLMMSSLLATLLLCKDH